MNTDKQAGSISYQLIQIGKNRRNQSNTLLSGAGIHEGQDILLYYLSLEDGQTITALVEKMCNKPATVSTTVDRMVAGGLLRKEKDKTDQRATRIYLTQDGKETYKKVKQIWKEMETRIVSNLTETEQATLLKLLVLVSKNLA